MPFKYDDFYLNSPSTHTVPCSPLITHEHGSPVPVPDIDNSQQQQRGINVPLYTDERHATTPRVGLLYHGLSPPLFRQPKHLTSGGAAPNHKLSTPRFAPTFEQVVPSCSPFISQSQAESQSQSTQMESQFSSKETVCSQSQCIDTKVDNGSAKLVPSDEKPALNILDEKKRYNRDLAQPSSAKYIDLFQGDDIFG